MSAKILASTENIPYADWLELRKLGIGGSDASVVCGINRYKSPVELWLDKTASSRPRKPGKLPTGVRSWSRSFGPSLPSVPGLR